jgi:hypothetical protein
MSNSHAHTQYPRPTTVLGGACGKLKKGQQIQCPEHTPLANLWLTLLNRSGIPTEALGDSTGQFAEI